MSVFQMIIDILQGMILSSFLLNLLDVEKKRKIIGIILMTFVFSAEIMLFDLIYVYEGFYSIAYSLTILLGSMAIMKNVNLVYIIYAVLINILTSVVNCMSLSYMYIVYNANIEIILLDSKYLNITSIVSTISLVLLSILIVKKAKNYISILVENSKYYLLAFLIFYISITLVEDLIFLYYPLEDKLLTIYFILIILFIILLFIFLKNIQTSIEKTNLLLINQQSNYLKERFSEFEKSAMKIKVLRHDLKRILYSLNNMIEDKKYESIQKYINEQIDTIEYETMPVNTGKHSIDCVLSLKSLVCKDKKISFIYTIDKSCLECIDEFDLSLLLLNVLDNAIENVSENGTIKFVVQKVNNIVLFRTENTVDSDVITLNPKLNTRKNNQEIHGFGIESIKMIVKKYEGQVDFKQNKNVFVCSIAFPTTFSVE